MLLAAAALIASLFLPFYSGTNAKFIPSYELTGQTNFLILIITVGLATMILVNIFLFRNRKLQLRICIIGMIIEAWLIYLYYRQTTTFLGGTYALTSLLQVLVLFLLFASARGVSNDMKVIKESERLR
jgi:uncharacterized membrane protein